jgi:hypothetical protein
LARCERHGVPIVGKVQFVAQMVAILSMGSLE